MAKFEKGKPSWNKGLNKIIDNRLNGGRPKTTGSGWYRTSIIKEFCSICNSDKFLLIHHIDQNREHNELDNLQVVCKSCHQKIHKVGRFLPKEGGWSKRK